MFLTQSPFTKYMGEQQQESRVDSIYSITAGVAALKRFTQAILFHPRKASETADCELSLLLSSIG